jgi:hypothetical protein
MQVLDISVSLKLVNQVELVVEMSHVGMAEPVASEVMSISNLCHPF